MIARIKAIFSNHYLCCITLAALTLLVFCLLLLTALAGAAIALAHWVARTAPAWTVPCTRAVFVLTIIIALVIGLRRTRTAASAPRRPIWLSRSREDGA